MGIGSTPTGIEYCSMGDFYFSTASAEDASLTAEITAYDWVYWLEKHTYKNTETGTWTLEAAVDSILSSAGIECEVLIPDEVREVPLQKVVDSITSREALRLAVQAACCTAYFDRDSRFVVTRLALSETVDELDSNNMTEPPVVTMESAVNMVELSVKNAAGVEKIYTASGILKDEMPQVKSVSNPMVDTSMGQAVADWLLAMSQGRLTYTTSERGNPQTEVLDTVRIYDYFGVNRNTIITKQTFTFDGGLSAESEAISYEERIAAYRLAMSMAKAMLEKGIISEKEYGVIDRLMAEKYGISLSSIFR